jgi:hypothetical protein
MQQPSPNENPEAQAGSPRERWDDYWGLNERNRPLARLRYELKGCISAVGIMTELFPEFSEMKRVREIAQTILQTIYAVPFSEVLTLAEEAETLLNDRLIQRVLETPLAEELEDDEKREFLEGLVRAVKKLHRLLLEIQPHTI